MISRGLKDELIKLAKRLTPDIDVRDTCVFGGIGMVGYGISLLSPAAAWVVVGLAFFWLGVR